MLVGSVAQIFLRKFLMAHYLDKLFNPTSIAVFGASDKKNAVGNIVFKNLLEEGYAGKLFAINPKYITVQGTPCFQSIDKIGTSIDLALIATPASTVVDILKQCGEKGVPHAIVFSSGFGELGTQGAQLEEQIKEVSKIFGIRVLGPNCLGILLPYLRLNATFTNTKAYSGHVALVSQSGGVCAGILDWAMSHNIGFSAMVSVGNAASIDFADILDYLAQDIKTRSILLYIESVHDGRRFIRSLREASKTKPVIIMKAGRHQQGIKAAITHTGSLIGSDEVFDAALRRAGAVRVISIEQLLSAAMIFSKNFRVKNEGLAIITNGGGIGVIAADHAQDTNISLALLSENNIKYLNSVLPNYWSHGNPIDILGDATSEQYKQVVQSCIHDPNIEGILIILVPVVMSDPTEVAKEIITITKESDKPILTCWLGQSQVESAWKLFAENNVPSFKTPESAIDAFADIIYYYHNQKLILEKPKSVSYDHKKDISSDIVSDVNAAKIIINLVLAENRKILSLTESKAILKAFGIPITSSIKADSPENAILVAERIGFPVVMKISSPDITHKQEVHGVQLNIINAEGVQDAFKTMVIEAKRFNPKAKILGVTLEPMQKEANDRELMIGVFTDPLFGPVISFGAGGTNVEVLQDRAIALPPLNQQIARRLISKTRIKKLLGPFRNMPAVKFDEIEQVLLKVSEMVCELPQIREMDINPLIANEQGIIAVDARIVVEETKFNQTPYNHIPLY